MWHLPLGASKLFMPRLVDATPRLQGAKQELPSVDPDSLWAITGGTGALGLLFASWLASRGAAHFALLSRSGQPPADSKAKGAEAVEV